MNCNTSATFRRLSAPDISSLDRKRAGGKEEEKKGREGGREGGRGGGRGGREERKEGRWQEDANKSQCTSSLPHTTQGFKQQLKATIQHYYFRHLVMCIIIHTCFISVNNSI